MKAKTKETTALERVTAEVKELRIENEELRQYILALQGEVYGARLAAKYLDKELAGRWVSDIRCNQDVHVLLLEKFAFVGFKLRFVFWPRKVDLVQYTCSW